MYEVLNVMHRNQFLHEISIAFSALTIKVKVFSASAALALFLLHYSFHNLLYFIYVLIQKRFNAFLRVFFEHAV